MVLESEKGSERSEQCERSNERNELSKEQSNERSELGNERSEWSKEQSEENGKRYERIQDASECEAGMQVKIVGDSEKNGKGEYKGVKCIVVSSSDRYNTVRVRLEEQNKEINVKPTRIKVLR